MQIMEKKKGVIEMLYVCHELNTDDNGIAIKVSTHSTKTHTCQTTSFNRHAHKASWYGSITLDSANRQKVSRKITAYTSTIFLHLCPYL